MKSENNTGENSSNYQITSLIGGVFGMLKGGNQTPQTDLGKENSNQWLSGHR